MIALGIESTSHTFAASIVSDKKKVHSDVRDMYKSGKEGWGIVPAECAAHHRNVADSVIRKAISDSDVKKIDLVSYSAAPGLPPSLHVGLNKAKEYAKELDVPLVGVNHCVSHLTSGHMFTPVKDPIYIFVSGANTQLISLEGKRFRIIGDTLDVGIGNALDKFGRNLGIGFPAGPKIEEYASDGNWIDLPYVVKGMDLSFSGIVTAASNKFKQGGYRIPDLCYSIQETFFSMLTEVTERAMAHCNKKEAVIIGGVAANQRLIEMLTIMCRERNAKMHAVPLKYSGDNAVMIAYQGLLQYNSGYRDKKPDIRPYERTDEVEVTWL